LELSGGTLSAQTITSDSGTYGNLSGYGTVSGTLNVTYKLGGCGVLMVEGSLAGDQGYFEIGQNSRSN